jgi:hypothetical protein
MARFKIQWMPRASWQPDVDADDQRWTDSPNVFTGTEEQATLECSDLDAAFDRVNVFRAVPVPLTADEEIASDAPFTCPGCGGDFRSAAGTELACNCARPVHQDVYVPRELRWVRVSGMYRAGKVAP